MNAWIELAILAGWLLLWGTRPDPIGSSAMLHWPIAAILIMGYRFDLKGGMIAGLGAALFSVLAAWQGAVTNWTLVGWQFLVYGFFALYPYKFMQIRTQRRSHFSILTEYKQSEIDALKRRLADLDAKCREIEKRLRGGAR